MNKQIKLNKEISVDIEKLIQSRMVILANSGGGKSWAIRRIAEQSVDKVQTIIIDPEGEFASLREKHDFILCGKNADVPVEVRSASLLATKLLEITKSAVIDLYELHPQERQRFVKIFCEALVNAPKDLYHPVLIILDEAHDYVPEGKPSEATYSVEALASKGRKRGQCLILASQRISKLSKNASAECNNKLIGRASQDIDYMRAGAELGFNKADSAVKLRNLKPGEFYAYGPAISDDIIDMRIGEVHTTHAKVGYKGMGKVPPASSAIKKILGELKDLPQEAEKEAKTVQELKAQIEKLRREGRVVHDITVPTRMIEEAVKKMEDKKNKEIFDLQTEYLKQVQNWFKILKGIGESMDARITQVPQKIELRGGKVVFGMPIVIDSSKKEGEWEIKNIGFNSNRFEKRKAEVKYPDGSIHTHDVKEDDHGKLVAFMSDKSFGRCARAIYSYLYSCQGKPMTKTQTAIATGYSQNSGGFNNAISELSAAGLIARIGGSLTILESTHKDLIIDVDVSLEKWLPKLGACSRKIWETMLAHHKDEFWTKEQMAQETGYSATSGGFNNSISELSSLGLIERLPGGFQINREIINV